jgi:hypothetical protein
MKSKFSAVPNLDLALVPYLQNVFDEYEEICLEPDELSSDVFVLLMPIAGIKVKCLFDLQTISMLDIR